ncbi:hypothetical protein Q7P35_011061 [Cladosporium inversicolor]
MAPGRPTGVKTEGVKTSIGGIGGRGVAGKGLGMGKSGAKRHSDFVWALNRQGRSIYGFGSGQYRGQDD